MCGNDFSKVVDHNQQISAGDFKLNGFKASTSWDHDPKSNSIGGVSHKNHQTRRSELGDDHRSNLGSREQNLVTVSDQMTEPEQVWVESSKIDALNHYTHSCVFPDRYHQNSTILNSVVEGVFRDPEFPATKASIMGMGWRGPSGEVAPVDNLA